MRSAAPVTSTSCRNVAVVAGRPSGPAPPGAGPTCQRLKPTRSPVRAASRVNVPGSSTSRRTVIRSVYGSRLRAPSSPLSASMRRAQRICGHHRG